MSHYNTIINSTVKFVKSYMTNLNDISHDYTHIKLVIKYALEIAKKESITNKRDLFHIKMGALLHDIGDSKYTNGNQFIIIKKYLQSIKKLSSYDISEILKISANVSLSKDTNPKYDKNKLKLYIVQDADRINSLGSIGIMRYISYNVKNMKEPSFSDIINTIELRTNKIKLFIRTKTGKNIAKSHIKLVNDFILNYKRFKCI